MLTAISCAKESYEEVYYVNTSNPSNRKDLGKDIRVRFFYPGNWACLWALVKSFFSLFSPPVFNDAKRCIKEKGISFKTIKHFLVEQYVHNRLFPLARKAIIPNEEGITVLSTWFAASSFTAAKLKQCFPSIKAVSLAHSYEILSERNPYVKYMHEEYKHKNLDGVYFISQRIREMYLDGIGGLPEELKKKTYVRYLGSIKESDCLNVRNSDVFCICSCSRMVPLKRVELLLDAIAGWNLCPIKWTHMGDGPLFEDISKRAKEICEKNPLVNIELTGRVSNENVKRFYANNPVDLFVNLSEIEGLPVSIMEAISYGIPVLATNVGGTCEIVVPETGYLVPKSITMESVRSSLIDYYSRPDQERATLRESAYKYWEEHFNATNNLRTLFEDIENISS